MTGNLRRGFTLIELIMVIAILAIVTTLAVGKFGGVSEMAARSVSVANQQSVGRAIEAFVALNPGALNKLDSLICADANKTGSAGFDYSEYPVGSRNGIYRGTVDTSETVRSKNSGISDGLVKSLCAYRVTQAEADALVKFGMKYVMCHATDATNHPAITYRGDDGSIPQIMDSLNPNLSAFVARAVTNGTMFAAIDATRNRGRLVYQACGQDLPITRSSNDDDPDVALYNSDEVAADITAAGGKLLAFGLGDSASIVGAVGGGLEAAPYSAVLLPKYYRRYIVLIRLRESAGAMVTPIAEFAGVLDPEGNTIQQARLMLK